MSEPLLNTDQLKEAREWLAELAWADMGPEDFASASDADVQRAIAKHYDGGIPGFLRDQMPEPPKPSRELLRSAGNHAYILALAASFPCLKHKVDVLGWAKFDADRWMCAAGPWSSGERYAALFVVCVWNPGYAEACGWRFDLFDAVGTWDTGNRKAALAWIADPVWP